MQALPGTDATREYDWLNTRGPLDKRYMVFRLGCTDVRRVPVVGGHGAIFRRRASRLEDKFERVHDRAGCGGLVAVSALELGLLRAVQSRFVQQWRAVGYYGRFNATVPADSQCHCYVPGNVGRSRNARVRRPSDFSYDNLGMFASAGAEP